MKGGEFEFAWGGGMSAAGLGVVASGLWLPETPALWVGIALAILGIIYSANALRKKRGAG